MLEFLLDPPPAFELSIVVVGLGLIAWQIQRRSHLLRQSLGPRVFPDAGLDSAIEATKHLSSADRERLSDALYDISQLLDNAIWNNAHTTVQQILSDNNNYTQPISPNMERYRRELAQSSQEAHNYCKRLADVQDKWKYYSLQISYIIGHDPDHGERGFEEAIDGFMSHFDRWNKIENVDDRPMREILNFSQNAFNEPMSKFANWQVYCARRLQQIRNALRQ